ncbi:MAG: hypothetical protein V3W18_06445 [candidate division Zixibacteria bacterium]
MKLNQSLITTILILAVSAILIGCGKKANPISPFQPEVSNLQDNFQFQATGLTNMTTSVSYNWENSGTSANVDQSCAITAGSASVTISDVVGTEMYSGDLIEGGSFVSSQGTAGTWVITLSLYDVNGTVNFRVQTP